MRVAASDLSTSSLLNFESVPISTPIILFPRFLSSGANSVDLAAAATAGVLPELMSFWLAPCSENFLFAAATEEAIINGRL